MTRVIVSLAMSAYRGLSTAPASAAATTPCTWSSVRAPRGRADARRRASDGQHLSAGRNDDGVGALRCGQLAIDRGHLVRDVVPPHAVGKYFVVGIETGRVESIWRSDRDEQLKERAEFEHGGNNDLDRKAQAKLSTFDVGSIRVAVLLTLPSIPVVWTAASSTASSASRPATGVPATASWTSCTTCRASRHMSTCSALLAWRPVLSAMSWYTAVTGDR